MSFCSLALGLTNPLLALIYISIYFVARIVYTLGYRKSAQARSIAAPFIILTPVVMIVTTIVCYSILIAKGNEALKTPIQL